MENIKYWELASIERSLDSDIKESLSNVYRVMIVNEELNYNKVNSPIELLDVMKNVVREVPIFKGDEKIFYTLYLRLSELNEREIIEYVNYLLKNARPLYETMIPECLSNALLNNVVGAQSVLVTDCEKYGPELYDIIKKNKIITFSFTVKDIAIRRIYEKIFSKYSVRFVNPEIYDENFISEKYDLILSFPIMGGRSLYSMGDFISRDMSFIATQNLLYHLTQEGKLIIILPAKIGFAGGDAEVLREYISKQYQLNEIASLPSRVFYPYMSMNTYILSISQGITDAVKITKYAFNKNKEGQDELIVEDTRLLFSDELESMNNWNVDMAFSITDETIMNYKNSSVRKESLKNVADIFRGKAVSKSESGNISVINISNITDTGIDYDCLDAIEDEERKVARYLLDDGDVLIATKGFNIKIAVFEKQSKLVIASSNLCVVRPNSKLINGTYLKLFLESETGMKLLKSLQRGTTIININYKDICELEVPVPPMDYQFEIVNEYNAGLKLYKETIASANYAWQKIKNNVTSKLF